MSGHGIGNRLERDIIHDHQAALWMGCKDVHVLACSGDGCRIGNPARELLGSYVWVGRRRTAGVLPPQVAGCSWEARFGSKLKKKRRGNPE